MRKIKPGKYKNSDSRLHKHPRSGAHTELFICCIHNCLGDTCCNHSLHFTNKGALEWLGQGNWIACLASPTNVQDCHKMSKLYLVHLRPLGLHGILVVVLSIQVPVVPSCPWDNPGHPRNPPLFYTNLPVPDAKLPWDNPGHPGNLPLPYTILPVPGPSCPKLPWDNPGHPRNSPPTC